jgi:Tfp pilus assembly protein PilZ
MFTKSTKKKQKAAGPGKQGEAELKVYAEKRSYERFHTSLDARLFYGKLIYAGKITDLSQKGMFINTKVEFPVNSKFMLVVLLEGRTVKIPIKVIRTSKTDINNDPESGIGVELLDTPGLYLDFIGRCWFSKKVFL